MTKQEFEAAKASLMEIITRQDQEDAVRIRAVQELEKLIELYHLIYKWGMA